MEPELMSEYKLRNSFEAETGRSLSHKQVLALRRWGLISNNRGGYSPEDVNRAKEALKKNRETRSLARTTVLLGGTDERIPREKVLEAVACVARTIRPKRRKLLAVAAALDEITGFEGTSGACRKLRTRDWDSVLGDWLERETSKENLPWIYYLSAVMEGYLAPDRCRALKDAVPKSEERLACIVVALLAREKAGIRAVSGVPW
jgi:hypothetical protein